LAAALIPAILVALAAQTAQTTPPPPAFRVEVIETTPLAGVDLPLDAIPSPAQSSLDTDIRASGALDVSDFLNRRLASVFVNEIQGNPFQADVSFRGYTASPLLGTPQGLSVYMDGVRLNQPFGDVVSWDLIPRVAVASTTMMPGSNPLFGLNTLGGALAVQTKDGRGSPGTSVQAIAGAYGRRAIEFEHGRQANNGIDWYFAGNLFHDGGWRPSSASDVRQVFAKIGWRDARTELHLTGAYADNVLNGNGLQELRLLAADYSSVYTTPDTTANRATFVNVTARRSLTPQSGLSLNAYFRDIRTATVNGDVNEASLDQNVYAAGENALNTQFPFRRCLQQVAARDEPGEKCTGLMNRTDTAQRNYGASGQLTVRRSLTSVVAARNQFTAGGAFDRSTIAFLQTTELGYVNPERGITPLNVFADGSSAGTVDGVPFDNRADLSGRVATVSAFATDTLSIADAWHITLSGRFNSTGVDNVDRLVPAPGAGSLTGTHTFNRFNSSAGVTFSPAPALNLYAGYSEGSRAPTSIELGCADPQSPCKLPNALIGDPPLDQVVTRTWEAGARGGRPELRWNAGVFRAGNANDLLFVASTATGFGYFKNFGETRRQGVELGATARRGRLTSGVNYAFTAATYETDEVIAAAGNSANRSGAIAIHPGDRIPMIPRHTVKAWTDVQATRRLAFDVDAIAASGSTARGNENGAHQPDGVRYLGPGASPGYVIVSAGARVGITRRLQAVAQINNLFDERYYSAAQLGPAAFTGTGTLITRGPSSTFYAPGAPATFWIGLRLGF
jgi:outer membrane receptor protein involved in Fe transport